MSSVFHLFRLEEKNRLEEALIYEEDLDEGDGAEGDLEERRN